MQIHRSAVALAFFCLTPLSTSRAAVVIDLVAVGDPGNRGEMSARARIVGGVNYSYQMGKFEVTNGQYVQFLNSVARTDDPHRLFEGLTFNGRSSTPDVGLERHGTPGGYSYSLLNGDENWRNRPVAGTKLACAHRG